jgi:phage anti-repressor protein
MNELIKVVEGNGRQAVNARDLHEALGVGRDFSNWIKGRIEEYGFVEGEDYRIIVAKIGDYSGPGNPNFVPKDYLLSVGMAKELAIVENNDTGRKIRRYLIRLEEEFITALKLERQAALEKDAVLRSLPPCGSPQGDYPYKFFYSPRTPQIIDALSRAAASGVLRRSEILAVIMGKSEKKARRDSQDAILPGVCHGEHHPCRRRKSICCHKRSL